MSPPVPGLGGGGGGGGGGAGGTVGPNFDRCIKGALKRVELPAYFFEFLTRFSKHKPDWSIQRHRERVTKLLFSRGWQLFLQLQVIDGV